MVYEVNNKPAVRIFAKKVKGLDKYILFDCEGDMVWLAKSAVKIVDKESILVEEWLYKLKFLRR